MTVLAAERATAIRAVFQASRVCQKVLQNFVDTEAYTKSDDSPVTGNNTFCVLTLSIFVDKYFINISFI